MTVNLTPPTLARLFNGRILADELEGRYLVGVSAVHRLEPAAFGPDLDPAGKIMAAIDIALPTVDWDAPQRVDGITPEQQRITIIRFTVHGPSDRLTWVPRQHQIGAPPARFGLADGHLSIVCTGYTLTGEQVNAAITQTRRHVTANNNHQIGEVAVWRTDTARRIRDAVSARAALLNTLPS